MSGILSILPVIIIAIIGSLISNASKRAQQAREEAARQQQGARKVATMDDQLREQIRQRAAAVQAARQAPAADPRFPFEPSPSLDSANSRWPIEPKVVPSEKPALPSVAAASPRVAVNYAAGGPQDRSVTRNVMQPRYNAEDSHGRTRAPHLQDDERGMDSFTGAATFRRSAPRIRGEKVDIRPLLQTPLAMANAVILTEVLHHRGGRSAKWSR